MPQRNVLLREVARAALLAAEASPEGATLVFDRELRLVDAGGPDLVRFGWDPDAVRGRTLDDVLPGAYFARVRRHFEEAADGEAAQVELPTVDGAAVFATRFSAIRDADGSVAGVFVVAHEKAAAAEPAGDGSADGNGRGALTQRERTVLALAAQGLTTVEIASELVLAPSTIESHIRRAGARLRARNRAHAVTLALATGQIDLDALALGVTRRGAAEDEDDRGAEAVFALSPLPMLTIASEGGILRANPAYRRGLGWSDDDIRGRDIFTLVHPGDQESARAAFATLVTGDENELVDVAARHLHRDGGWRWMAWSGARSPDGRTIHAIARPIAAPGDLEERMHRPAEALLRAIAFDAPLALYLKDTDSRYLYANHFVEAHFGVVTGGLIGKRDDEFLPQEVAEGLQAHDRCVIEGGEILEREELLDMSGRLRTFLTAKFPVRDHLGEVQAIAGVSVEIPPDR